MRVDPKYVTNLSSALDESGARQQQLTAELSSGLAISSLSDNPTVTAQNSLLNTDINQQDTYVSVAGSEIGRLQVADSSLSETVTQLTTAIGLATQAANGTLNKANLSALQQEVSGIRDTVVSLANTSYTGAYLFSGSKGTTEPFTSNASAPLATFTYNGDSNTQSVVTPGGQAIAVSLSGAAIFSQSLTALNQLAADLGLGASGSTIAADGAALSTALAQLSGQRTTISNSLSRLNSTSSYAQTQEVNLKITQSSLVSADTAKVATDLSQAKIQNDALLNVIAALSKNNLFDYLK